MRKRPDFSVNDNTVQRENKQGVTLTPRALALLIIIVILLVAGGIVLGLNWNRWFGEGETAATEEFNPDIDPGAEDWSGQQLEDAGGASTGIKIPGYPSITLRADTQDVSVAFLNPEGNPCYFTFELTLKDTDEVLYTSKLVPPGQAIYDITLSQPLEAGEYNAVIRISTTSLEDGSAMNGANVETVLIVQ